MGNARNVIGDALKLIGVYEQGETLGASEGTDGLRALNLLMGAWDNEGLALFFTRQVSLALTSGTGQYDIGHGGDFIFATGTAQTGSTSTTIKLAAAESSITDLYRGFQILITAGTSIGERKTITAYNGSTKVATVEGVWTATPDNTSVYDIEEMRPLSIESAFTRDANSLDVQITCINSEQWARIYQKNIQTTYPDFLYYRPKFPLGEINLYPLPGSGLTLYLEVRDNLTLFPTLDSEVFFPPGYERALGYNLAVEIAPQYEKQAAPSVVQAAMDSKAGIKTTNIKVPILTNDLPGLSGGSYREQFFSGN